jgi:hypothetical protein
LVIGATGTIMQGDTARLKALVARVHAPAGSTVVFDSPGGSVGESIMMADAIRSFGFSTVIGQLGPNEFTAGPPGRCFSACTFAFLGGVTRHVPGGSVYGVHRFFLRPQATGAGPSAIRADPMAATEGVDGLIVAFYRRMGVDPILLTVLSHFGPDQIGVLPPEALRKLGVVTDAHPTVWTLAASGGLAAMASTIDARGSHGLRVSCLRDRGTPEPVMVAAIADHDPEGDIVGRTTRLVLSDAFREVPGATSFTPGVPRILVTIRLAPDMLESIRTSSLLGVALVGSVDPSSSFVGFAASLTPEGKADVEAVAAACH